jgi:hypothetical protein
MSFGGNKNRRLYKPPPLWRRPGYGEYKQLFADGKPMEGNGRFDFKSWRKSRDEYMATSWRMTC